MRVAHLNTDRGVRPGKSKGAVVHVQSMRAAFQAVGAEVLPIDAFDSEHVRSALGQAQRQAPLDLVYERFALHSDWGSRFAAEEAIPHVLEINAPLDEEERRHRPGRSAQVDRGALAAQLRGAQQLLCVSDEVARWALARGGRASSIAVVGNGVDTSLFSPQRRQAGLARGLTPAGAFVIGFHGRLRPWHAFGRLVAALTLLDARLPFHLLLIGVGEFEREIGASLPRERWTHLPWCPHEQVGELVATFDVMPLSYDPDQPCYFSPLKLLEGMAAGVVPIVPRLGALPQAVGEGEAGAIYDAHELESLARILTRLCGDPSLRGTLADAARARAARQSWTGIAARVLAEVGAEVQ